MPRRVIDEGLIKRITEGDETAFAALYDAYWSYLTATAATFIRNGEAAKEMVNDLFVKIWASRRSLRSPIHPYLMTALRNHCLNYLRKRREETMDPEEILRLDADIERTETRTPLAYMEAQEVVQAVRRVSDTLPDRCRMIFHLYFFKGLETSEIARRMEISPSTVRVQMKIALDRIRLALGEEM